MRAFCNQWLTVGRLNPFSVLIRIRRVAFAAARTETARYSAEWNDDHTEIMLKGSIVVKLSLIPALYQGLLDEAWEILGRLTSGHSTEFPEWASLDQIVDDPSNKSTGYSLLGDHALEMWPLRTRSLEAFMASSNHVDIILSTNGKATNWKGNTAAMGDFMALAQKLNEIFIVLFHVGGGPPSRATELFTLAYRNGAGTKRTLFAPNGKLYWSLAYSKVYTQLNPQWSLMYYYYSDFETTRHNHLPPALCRQ